MALAMDQHRVHRPAAVVDRCVPDNLDEAGLGIDLDFTDGASIGVGWDAHRFVRHPHQRSAQIARDAVAECRGCDLEQADAGDRIAAALAAEGVEVEYVVNNAGFGMFGQAIERDRLEQLGMIGVNIRALTDLSLRFSEHLIRHRGGILNIGSVAGFLPGPGMAVYYASKAYVLSFSEALRRELAPRGVRVTVLCPGPVLTEFQGRAGFLPGFDSAVLNISAFDAARAGYRGLMANKRAVLPGLGIKIVPLLLRFFPRGFVLAAVGRLQLRKR